MHTGKKSREQEQAEIKEALRMARRDAWEIAARTQTAVLFRHNGKFIEHFPKVGETPEQFFALNPETNSDSDH